MGKLLLLVAAAIGGAVRALTDRRGNVAVEFALIAPVLLAVLGAIIQFGNILSTQQTMIYAAREAARSYATGNSTSAEAQTLAQSRLAATGLTYTITVTDDGTNVTVNIAVPMADAAIINILSGLVGTLMPGNITASITMRLET